MPARLKFLYTKTKIRIAVFSLGTEVLYFAYNEITFFASGVKDVKEVHAVARGKSAWGTPLQV